MRMTKEEKLEKQRLEKLDQIRNLEEFRATLPQVLFGYMETMTKMRDLENLEVGFSMDYTENGLEVKFDFFYSGYENTETIKLKEAEPWEIAVLDDCIERTRVYAEQLRREAEEARIKEQKRKELINKLSQEYSKEDLELVGVKIK